MGSVMSLLSYLALPAEVCPNGPTQIEINDAVVVCGSTVRESSREREPIMKYT